MKYIKKAAIPVMALMFSLCVHNIYAQVGNNLEQQSQALLRKSIVVPPSAEASELGKYGEYNVNTYTGVPSIQIPIFAHGSTELPMNIGLTYNASGIKVADAPTLVGSGWSMSGLPIVSRTVLGDVDNAMNYFVYKAELEAALDAPQPSDIDDDEINLLYDLANGTLESQTDIFHYTLLDRSGKFYITPDTQIIQKEYSDIIIHPSFGNNAEITAFLITDEYGRMYYFNVPEKTTMDYDDGDTDPAEDVRLSHVNQGATTYNSSWHVSSIRSKNDQELISYTYQTDTGQKAIPLNEDLYTAVTYQKCDSDSAADPSPVTHPGLVTASYLINKRRIQSITHTLNGQLYHLNFTTSPVSTENAAHFYSNDYKLDNIKMSRNGSDIKQWDFNYKIDASRLMIESVQEKSASGTEDKPAHIFTYVEGSLPAFDDDGIDHWGYYNGSSSLIPTYTYGSGDIDASNREPNATLSKYGTLKSIKYPTGGRTEFDFELHSLATTSATNVFIPMTSTVYESCVYDDDLTSTCCEFNQQESIATYGITISQDQIDNGYLKIISTPVQCVHDGIDPIDIGTNTTVSYGIEIFPMDSNTDDPNNILDSYFYQEDLASVNDELIQDKKFNFTFGAINDPGDYQIKLIGFSTRVTAQWYENEIETITVTKPVGGLRVETISVYDQDDTQILETGYEYSDGILFATPDYVKTGSYHTYFVPGFEGGAIEENHCVTVTITAASKNDVKAVQGSPIGYGRVEKKVINNFGTNTGTIGKTVYHYHNEPFSSIVSDPVTNGKLQKVEIFNAGGSLVSETSYGYSFDNFDHNNSDNLFYGFAVVPKADQDNEIFFYQENGVYVWDVLAPEGISSQTVKTKLERKSNGYRLMQEYHVYPTFEETTEHFYGANAGTLVSRKEYVYGSDNHLQPTEIKTIVGNGQTYIEKMAYPENYNSSLDADVTNNAVGDHMESRNIILPAWKTELYIGNISEVNLLDGSKTLFDLKESSGFNLLDNQIFPIQNLRYELASDGNGAWENQYEIIDFNLNVNRAEEVSYEGWPATHRYSWSNTGKLESIKYHPSGGAEWEWSYTYDPIHDQLESTTDPNGITNSYIYDGLLRLEQMTAREATVGEMITNYSYNYGSTNSIAQTTNFDFGINTSSQEYDGIGRLKTTIFSDGSTSTVSYDNAGRVLTETDAIAGTFTTTYLADPLNRPSTKNHASGLGNLSFDYGTGSTPLSNVANTRIQTTTDGDGKVAISYTDILGRILASSAGTQGNLVHTITEYDDKSRISAIHPPAAFGNITLGYQYTYDGDDNVLTAKFPDKAMMEYAYDDRNLQIATTDGIISSKGWLITAYDDYGRVDQTGFGPNPTSITEVLSDETYNDPTFKMLASQSITMIMDGLDPSAGSITTDVVYDNAARTELLTINNSLLGIETINYSFDNTDNILTEDKNTAGIVTNVINNYDGFGRLDDVSMNHNGIDVSCDYQYYIRDQIGQKILGDGLQTIDYSYLSNGWLSGINSGTAGNQVLTMCPDPSVLPNGAPGIDDLFSLDIRYDNPVNATASTNGNISELHWQVKGRQSENYSYAYDHLNRLLTADFSTGDAYNTSYTYDDRGNILTLDRNGMVTQEDCESVQSIDDLTYTYRPNSNQIDNITDEIETVIDNCPDYVYLSEGVDEAGIYAAEIELSSDATPGSDVYIDLRAEHGVLLLPGFTYETNSTGTLLAQIAPCPTGENLAIDQAAQKKEWGFISDISSGLNYAYDANGNMTLDPNKGLKFKYNHFNLPYEITDLEDNTLVKTIWSADGQKLRQESSPGSDTDTKDYFGNVEFNDNGLEAIYFDDARIVNTDSGLKTEYFLKDHLGNTRVMFSDKNEDGQITISDDETINEVLEEYHYYPFGMCMSGPWLKNSNHQNKYTYNGKEHISDLNLNLHDYGARYYDPAIARFTSVDPLADAPLNVGTSPYTYVWNNPLVFIDPDGRHGQTIYEDKDGNQVEVDDGIDKTIKVNDTDFEKALMFAFIQQNQDESNFIEKDAWGWSFEDQETQQLYSNFYNSVNSYDEFSVPNFLNYLFGGPDDGIIGIPGPGGPAVTNGAAVLMGAGKESAKKNVSGWIFSKELGKLSNKIGGKFIDAIQKGVTTRGSGIRPLTSREIKKYGSEFTHKLWVKGKGASHFRILGSQGKNGHWTFRKLINEK